MNNNFDKIIIFGIICLFGWYILSNIDKSNENKYIIEKANGRICGKEIYITDFTYNDELITEDLLEEIEYICHDYYN